MKNSDVLRRRRHPRDLNIWALVRLGWMQRTVGEIFGLTHSVVSRIVQNVDSNILNICQQFYDKKNFY